MGNQARAIVVLFLAVCFGVLHLAEAEQRADSRETRIRNTSIRLSNGDDIRLPNGGFHRGQSAFDPKFIEVKVISNVAFGDLKGDGQDDGVVIVGTSGGGSGFFPELHVLRETPQGEFGNIARKELGDRV